jgi:hypothetical protein
MDKALRDILFVTQLERDRVLGEVERRQANAERRAVFPLNSRTAEDGFTGQALGLQALGRWLRRPQ